ncbi:MAG: septum formation protein Maf [Bacteriovoracaceae bacterium]|nr:septum formation protein Maf [Bacteriovoracaceae bacterium]
MTLNKYHLILASKSPRRKELLGHLQLPFEIITAHVEEKSKFMDPGYICEDISKQKGQAVYDLLQTQGKINGNYFPLIIASDTVVSSGKKIYGKPSSPQAAKSMLKELSGKTHLVCSGVYLGCYDLKTKTYRDMVFSGKTQVTFTNISEDLLSNYLSTGDSLDKAGSYGIQGPGLTFISYLQGSYSNVMGFPLDLFIDKFKEFLGLPNDLEGKWRTLIHGANNPSTD